MAKKIQILSGTHIGDKQFNQDIYLVKKMDRVEKINDLVPDTIPYLFIIADGHGGKNGHEVAEFIVEKFEIKLNVKHLSLIKEDLLEIFDDVDRDLRKSTINYHKIGSTIIIGIMFQLRGHISMVVCQLGDCRMISNDFTTIDHKPDNEIDRLEEVTRSLKKMDKREKREKIKKINYDDEVTRIGTMAVSRAFGDYDTVPYIIHQPDIYEISIKNGYYVFACDGLWDYLSNKKVLKIITGCENDAIIQLIDKVREKADNEMDNTTIIILKIDDVFI